MKSVETSVVYGQSKKLGIYAIASSANAVAAKGASNIAAAVRIMHLSPESIQWKKI